MALNATLRNARALVRITLLMVAVGLVIAGAHTLAARAGASLDVTAAGEHRLSPRTEALLARLRGTYEIVLSVDGRGIDGRVRGRVEDVLDAFERTGGSVRVTTIDIGSAAGQSAAADLLSRLTAREADRVEADGAALASAGASLAGLAPRLNGLGEALGGVRDALPADVAATNGAFFEQRAAVLRVLARELDAIETDPPDASSIAASATLIETEATRVIEQAASLSGELRRLASAPEIARQAGPVVEAARAQADAITAAAERAIAQAAAIREPDSVRVRRVLETGPALIVVGPPGTGLGALAAGDLFVPAETLERAGLSAQALAGPRAEALIADAIGVVVDPVRPAVVLAHAELRSGLLDGPLLRLLRARLAEQGIEVVEWAVLEDSLPPAISSDDPSTPVVTIAISPDTVAGSGGDPETAGPRRAERLAEALAPVMARGEPVLLCLSPSVFPTYGDPDPLAALAEPFGISVRTGRPLLISAESGEIGTDLQPVAGGGAHPVAQTIEGLRLRMPWSVQIEVADDAALLRVEGGSRAWAERDWLTFWTTPSSQRALLRDPPTFDAGVDTSADAMVLAAAGSRRVLDREQRLIVIGSNSWLLDPIAQRSEQRGGRLVPTHPGNVELLDASINWLAGLDDRLAPSARARAISLIRPLDQRQLGVLRWALIAGVPGLILAVGLAVRLMIR